MEADLSTSGTRHGTRAKVMIGIAAGLVAAYFLKLVATVDPGSHSLTAVFAAKGIIGALGLIFCLFLYTDSGRLLRKIVGTVSLLVVLLLIVAVTTGVMAWLLESLPFADILRGNEPVAIAAAFVANAYIAWTFCFSSVVRGYKGKRRQLQSPVGQ